MTMLPPSVSPLRSLLVAALALALPGCSAPDGEANAAQQGPVTDAADATAPAQVLAYDNVTITRTDTDAIPFLVGGPLGPGAVLHTYGPRPEGFDELSLTLDWSCANCAGLIEMTFGVQLATAIPSEDYIKSVAGTGPLELVLRPDEWGDAEIQVSIVPSTDLLPVMPMVLVSYEFHGVTRLWEHQTDERMSS